MSGPWEKFGTSEEPGPWAKFDRRQADVMTGSVMNTNPAEGMSDTDKFLAGAGKAFADVGRGVQQRIANAGTSTLLASPVAAPTIAALKYLGPSSEAIQTEIDETKKRDAPLMDTKSGIAGNVVGNMGVLAGTSLIPGAGTGLGATAIGGAVGAAQPVATGESQALNTGLSAVGGAAGSALARGVSRVVQPQTRPHVRALLDEGVTPTPGQIMGGTLQRAEEKLRSVPILGDAITSAQRRGVEDLNRAAYARALNPIGGNMPAEVGREGVDAVSQQLSQSYGQLLPRMNFRADPQFMTELQTVRQMASTLPPQQAQQLEAIIQNQVLGKLTQNGLANGERLKEIESSLGRLAAGYRGDPSFDARQMGAAITEVQGAMRRTLTRMNPQTAGELADVNQGYSAYARIRDAASRQGSAEGVFTPAQLAAAVRAGDKSVGHGNYARGNAPMQDLSDAGVNVLASKYPDSGSVGRLLLGAGAAGTYPLAPAVPLALGAASLPYLPGGRQLAAALLARRPNAAVPVGRAIANTAPQAAIAGASLPYALQQ